MGKDKVELNRKEQRMVESSTTITRMANDCICTTTVLLPSPLSSPPPPYHNLRDHNFVIKYIKTLLRTYISIFINYVINHYNYST